MKIKNLRILPPFAIARVGSAATPVDNYVLSENTEQPLGFRTIEPAETLVVGEDGAIKGRVARRVQFKDGHRIRPVAPFLEVWVETDEEPGILRPLTTDMLSSASGDPDLSGLAWRVRVANRKVFRRTDDEHDIVEANTDWFADHDPHILKGHCENFVSRDSFIDFGMVRFIKPTPASKTIGLRFTPGKGAIYGPDERDIKNQPYRIVDGKYAIYRKDGAWVGYAEKTRDDDGTRWYRCGATGEWKRQRNDTMPTSLYAIETVDPPAPSWEREEELAVSRGYLDDTCDGFVEVRLKLDESELVAKARICSAPPAPVTDSCFVRTLADDLDQVIAGPQLPPTAPIETTRLGAEEILRRAFETVRFLNVQLMNGNAYNGRDPSEFDTMPELEAEEITGRPVRPVFGTGAVDTLAVLALHQNIFAALRAGVAPWFLQVLRQPHEAADFTDRGRRKMPALMIGADENYLALTYRQIDTVARAAKASAGREPAATGAAREALTPRNATARVKLADLSAQLRHHAAGNPVSSRPDSAIANCCPGLETDFRAVWRRTFKGVVLREYDNLVMETDDAHKHLKGTRLLRVDDVLVMAQILVPRLADPEEEEVLATPDNPHGLHPLEWSNLLARVLYVRRADGTFDRKPSVTCFFTLDEAWDQQQPWIDENNAYKEVLEVTPFFEDDTAVISEALAEPGELTQGLCSPWQNDFRECSCYYWASARPDFVNVRPGRDGLSAGDNWFQKVRTGDYVPDDYVNSELVLYDDLFAEWEKWIRFQIGGTDAPEEET